MSCNLMNNLLVHGTRRCIILMGFLVFAGCSWRTPVPADYVPDETPTEPWIIATPNPVPPGRGPGKTIVNWHTGDGERGQVYVSIGGGPEQLFSSNPSHQEATIDSKDEYEFRLYAGTDHATRLASVKVTREQLPRVQSPLDRLRRKGPR
jgi:hypothetical protein